MAHDGPKFCKACGKRTILYGHRTGKIMFDEYDGHKYEVGQKIIVCPDHKDDLFPSEHSRFIVEEYELDPEDK